jgi:hypothetical protein
MPIKLHFEESTFMFVLHILNFPHIIGSRKSFMAASLEKTIGNLQETRMIEYSESHSGCRGVHKTSPIETICLFFLKKYIFVLVA